MRFRYHISMAETFSRAGVAFTAHLLGGKSLHNKPIRALAAHQLQAKPDDGGQANAHSICQPAIPVELMMFGSEQTQLGWDS
jgi:hypothetical protein